MHRSNWSKIKQIFSHEAHGVNPNSLHVMLRIQTLNGQRVHYSTFQHVYSSVSVRSEIWNFSAWLGQMAV